MDVAKPGPGTEIELTLQVRVEDLPRLRDSPLLSAPGTAVEVTRTLDSVYFDTTDRRLQRQNTTLRVRKQGRRYVQTIKSAGRDRGGAFHRDEWESPLASAVPDLAGVSAEAANGHLGRLKTSELRPVFASHIKRTIRRIGNGADSSGAAIEIAFDEGEIRTPDGAALPVSEVELELKRGEPRALYDLALALSEIAPLRIESRSKAERGYALVDDEGKMPVHAAPIELTPDITVECALGIIIRRRGEMARRYPRRGARMGCLPRRAGQADAQLLWSGCQYRRAGACGARAADARLCEGKRSDCLGALYDAAAQDRRLARRQGVASAADLGALGDALQPGYRARRPLAGEAPQESTRARGTFQSPVRGAPA